MLSRERLNYYYLIASSEFLFSYKDVFEITPHYEITPSFFSYNHIPYPNVTNINQKLLVKYSYRFSNRLSLEGDFTHFHDSEISSNFQKSINVLNSAVVFQFQKGQSSQIKLTVFDILNQNTSLFRTVSGNGIYQGESLIQKRYFLITYQYKFAKSINSTPRN